MYLWMVNRTDATSFDEYGGVVVRAETSSEALRLVCGGPHPDYPDIKAFDQPPLRGYNSDGSNAEVAHLVGDGKPGILFAEFHAG